MLPRSSAEVRLEGRAWRSLQKRGGGGCYPVCVCVCVQYVCTHSVCVCVGGQGTRTTLDLNTIVCVAHQSWLHHIV